MMKCIFVMVLLQVCHCVPVKLTPASFTLDPNLNREILNDLRDLKKNVNHTTLTSIPTPGHYMLNYPSKCVDVFSQELREFLKNMTLEVAVKATTEKLVLKLESLAQHPQLPQNDSKCKMDMEAPSKTNLFKKHMEFIKKLNSRR